MTSKPEILKCNKSPIPGPADIPCRLPDGHEGFCKPDYHPKAPKIPSKQIVVEEMPSLAMIPLTQGKVAFVDAADYPELSKYKWFAVKNGHNWYAARRITVGPRKQRTVQMQHQLLNPGPGLRVDHRDNDGLNNRRANLRPATIQQNALNRRRNTNNKSGHTGVTWDKTRLTWNAEIIAEGKRHYLGRFAKKQAAIDAYRDAAVRLHGQYANQDVRAALATDTHEVQK